MCEKLKSYRKEISCINLLFKVWNKHIFKYNWQVYDAFVMKRKREQSQWSISLIIIKKEQLPLSSNSKASSWSYDRWMYNYPCNHCLSPLTWWVRTPFSELSSVQHYMLKYVSDLRQVGVVFCSYSGFLHHLKLTATI